MRSAWSFASTTFGVMAQNDWLLSKSTNVGCSGLGKPKSRYDGREDEFTDDLTGNASKSRPVIFSTY
jgi:hypothetical protein